MDVFWWAQSTKSFNRRTTALHFLVANIEKCTLIKEKAPPVSVNPPPPVPEDSKGASEGAGGVTKADQGLFNVMAELPSLQAAKRLVYADSLALVDEMRKGLSVLEHEMAKMSKEEDNPNPNPGGSDPKEEDEGNAKLREFVDYVKVSIGEVEGAAVLLEKLLLEAGNLFGQEMATPEARAKEPAYMFNLLYDFCENLNSARLERNQVDVCHKVGTANSQSPKKSLTATATDSCKAGAALGAADK